MNKIKVILSVFGLSIVLAGCAAPMVAQMALSGASIVGTNALFGRSSRGSMEDRKQVLCARLEQDSRDKGWSEEQVRDKLESYKCRKGFY